MSKPNVAGSLVLLVAVSVGVAGERQPVYRTPQEVFAAAKKAAQKEDWKGFCATLTDDSKDMLAGGLVMTPVMFKAFAKFAGEEKAKEILAKFKPLDEILAKNGITEDSLNKLKEGGPIDKDDPAAVKRTFKKLIAPIKDRCAFIAEMLVALKKVDEKKAKKGPFAADAELKDVMIEGNKAKGVIVSKKGEQEKREPIEFRKVGASWKVELPMRFGSKSGRGDKLPPGR